ncbi:MAG: tetratricopeptide repeat protein [Planctomycetes bacterium]|nr:tetratricopeptide repeat protein [Planctomycetota bacterium]
MSDSDSLGSLALDRGLISPAQLRECVEERHRIGAAARLDEILLRKGYLDADQILELLAGRASEHLTRPDRTLLARSLRSGLVTVEQVADLLRRISLERDLTVDTAAARLGISLRKDRVGPYQLLRELGHGGMGVVYAATDPRLRREVALKLLQAVPSPTTLERFRREAQALAKLHHSAIVQVFDVGEEEGRPYFVMELVEGQSLFDAVERRSLTLRERVEVVRQAAEAVQFAHEQGVLHRDLKPGNIVVTPAKKAMVLDFGLAKLQGGETLSASGALMGTPSYMSPEQASGGAKPVDARTDVWGLGATLYHTIAGGPPFTGSTVAEVVRKIHETEPRPPQMANAAVSRDLETICLKALEKEPGRRYATAREFAMDLGRYLSGEPILARPATTLYRLRRYLGRRKAVAWAIAAGVLAAAGLIGYFVPRLVKEGRAREAEAERSRRREAGLKKLSTLWATIVERKRDLRALRMAPERARRELAEAVAAVDGHIAEWPEDPQGYYVRARGKLYLGDLEGAEADIRVALAKRPDFRPGWSLLGMVKVEEWQREVLDARTAEERHAQVTPALKDAEAAFERGWERGKEKAEAEKWGVAWTHEDEVIRRLTEAVRLAQGGHPGHVEACRLLQGCMEEEYRAEEYARWIGNFSCTDQISWLGKAVEWAPGYSEAWTDLGNAKFAKGDFDGAISAYDRAVVLGGANAHVYYNRGTSRKSKGDFKGAIADLDRAIQLKAGFADAYNNRGTAKCALGDFDAAIADFDGAVKIKGDHAYAHCNRGIARRMKGQAFAAKGRLREASLECDTAITDFDRALEINKDFANAYLGRAQTRRTRVDLLSASGRQEEANREWKALIADLDAFIRLKGNSPEAYNNRASARQATGDLPGAIADYSRAIELKANFALAYLNRGLAKAASRDFDGAIADYSRAIEIAPDLADAYSSRGNARLEKGDIEGAISDLDRAIEMKKDEPRPYVNRGRAKEAKGDFKGAVADYEKALQMAPAGWPFRTAVTEFLRRAREKLKRSGNQRR